MQAPSALMHIDKTLQKIKIKMESSDDPQIPSLCVQGLIDQRLHSCTSVRQQHREKNCKESYKHQKEKLQRISKLSEKKKLWVRRS